MRMLYRLALLVFAVGTVAPCSTPALFAQQPQKEAKQADDNPEVDKKDDHKPIPAALVHNPVLWEDPGDIAAKDMLHGLGGEKGMPVAPFTFEAEVHRDSNPKFDIRDANDRKYRVKLGSEARPEVAASRFLWAVGYFTEEDYVLPRAAIEEFDSHRGGRFREGNTLIDARFARKHGGQKRLAAWEWKHNPFLNTREFNGLRVMMAVINSWDLKNENNAVFTDKKNDRQVFLVSDIGASFGTNSVRAENANGKGNAEEYRKSKFIVRQDERTVDFGTPGPATKLLAESGGLLAPLYIRHQRYYWIGKDIPRRDARWVGTMLGKLSHQQIVDAFTAGHFSPEEVDIYTRVMEERIAELQKL